MSDPALRDLLKIEEYVALDSPTRAAVLVDRILAKARGLARFAERHPINPGRRPLELRAMMVGPYRVYFHVGPHQVMVVRGWHASRRAPRAADLT